MLGHPAASQTVCRPSRRTSPLSSRNDGPMVALVRIHGGLRSMGIWLLRISRRSSLRPPGPDAGVLTNATLRGIRRYTGELRGACPEQSGGVLVAGSQARRHPAGGFTSLPEDGRSEVLPAADISRGGGVHLRQRTCNHAMADQLVAPPRQLGKGPGRCIRVVLGTSSVAAMP